MRPTFDSTIGAKYLPRQRSEADASRTVLIAGEASLYYALILAL